MCPEDDRNFKIFSFKKRGENIGRAVRLILFTFQAAKAWRSLASDWVETRRDWVVAEDCLNGVFPLLFAVMFRVFRYLDIGIP